MRNLKVKYSLLVLSYLVLIFLIIVSYVSIIPEKEIKVLEDSSPLIKEKKNTFINENDTVYEILEKKIEKPKTIESLIETEVFSEKNLKKGSKNLNEKKNFKLQLASFKDQNKSIEISKMLEEKFSKNLKIKLDVKQISIKNNETYFRVISEDLYSLAEAKNLCKKIIEVKNQCLIVIGKP